MLAMHMQQASRTGTFVQVIHILRDDQKIAFPFCIQMRQRPVRGVRLCLLNVLPPHIVKAQDQIRVAQKGFRCRHILHTMFFPQPATCPERINAAFG